MFMTLVEKEIRHHILSIRFAALLVMCLLLIPLTLSINYGKYLQNQVDYQEAVKRARTAAAENPPNAHDPNSEVSKLFLKPTPLSAFANGLEDTLPTYLGMTRLGVQHGTTALSEAPISYALGNLDFLFLVSTVFSLLALLFTFDAVTGEREAGTLRITLSNAVPRDIFLWSKFFGGYLAFVVPFLVAFLFGTLLLVLQGFPLGESDHFLRILCLLLVCLLYIAVFFAIGMLISTYLDSVKTALIVAFTVWVFAVLIAPRLGFLTAKLIAPTRTTQTVYMEKTALRNNLNREKEDTLQKKMFEELGTAINMTPAVQEKFEALKKPIDEEYRLKLHNQIDKVEQGYHREKAWQETVGETASRITPTSSFIYLGLNLTRTGKLRRNAYFQTGNRYYALLENQYFSNVADDTLTQILQLAARMDTSKANTFEKVPPPPALLELPLNETLVRCVTDLLLLCFFAFVLTTIAFLKFFRSDI